MLITLNKPITLEKEKITYKHVEIIIKHSHGGINYATYKQEQSGYFMHFSPCNYRQEKDYSVKEYGPVFNDYSFKIRIASGYRFSKKKLATLQEMFNNHKETIIKYYEDNDKASLYSYLTELYDKYLKD